MTPTSCISEVANNCEAYTSKMAEQGKMAEQDNGKKFWTKTLTVAGLGSALEWVS